MEEMPHVVVGMGIGPRRAQPGTGFLQHGIGRDLIHQFDLGGSGQDFPVFRHMLEG